MNMSFIENLSASASAAGGDTSTIIKPLSNLNSLLFDLVATIGVTALIIGIVMLALSLYNHDASQRIASIVAIAGGVLLISIKLVVTFLGG